MTRVLVTGSRTWTDRRMVWDALSLTATEYGINGLVVVHGKANGGDTFAEEWALANEDKGVVNEPHPAEWLIGSGANAVYNPQAGFQRNGYMVDLGARRCLAFLMFCTKSDCPQRHQQHYTHGAAHCLGLALAAGIPVVSYGGGRGGVA